MDSGFVRVMRWVLIILGVLLFLSLIVLLISSIGGRNDQGTEEGQFSLDDYKTNASVKFVQNGQVTAPENQSSINIIVANDSRRIEIYNNYGQNLVNSQNFPNTQASYDAFLNALLGSGFFKTKEADGVEYASFCTLGIRYSYQAFKDGNQTQDTWNSSCNARSGSFNGNMGQTQQLFRNQIPNYNELVGNVRL